MKLRLFKCIRMRRAFNRARRLSKLRKINAPAAPWNMIYMKTELSQQQYNRDILASDKPLTRTVVAEPSRFEESRNRIPHESEKARFWTNINHDLMRKAIDSKKFQLS